ncbi:hypothetical protein HanXRQr2_Chr05g0236411 [Helianthus annuus]|uniref:Uncharacterized protein n=1 Tax=Helianthus annuus TaxID=4232 RepID=A0A251UTN8_HELAN|nr:ESX-1 secretion-associated protein EspB isoform X1 [Helianthus annuus]XP_022039732.1 ESX-1 secretion-associated protein EspB isoform X1 [Helianthus annuus]XP_035846325.1 ESX-1 secretion-associated protein EspB isoform X1 [Helianthus annuus]KAF5807684.1 hypothetical protein HanXRQr2_Chr05g0236411 [Helianthus annuus]KAJ0571777.1 hypothetical protein HanHA300_Chr05g0193871 [Helianthus annuus]KAJ0586151.1 hypothetical protein HanHA89_Chr05g0208671 [Helianthus annuus]
MVEERAEVVYDIGYGYGNPCRYLQEVFRSFLRCLGLEKQEGKERNTSGGVGGRDTGGGDGDGDGDGDGGGGEVDPPTTSPIMDPTDEPMSTRRLTRRPPPPRGPISSGGGGQTN